MATKILIIDDIQSVRNAMRQLLLPPVSALSMVEQIIARGATSQAPALLIDEASQGLEGVALVEAAASSGRPYDLVFIDMLMPPGIDGVDTLGRIRSADPGVLAVVCSALSSSALSDEIVSRIGGPLPLILQKPLTHESNIRALVDDAPTRV